MVVELRKIIFYFLVILPFPYIAIMLHEIVNQTFWGYLLFGLGVALSGLWLGAVMISGDVSYDGDVITTKWSREQNEH